MPDDFAGHIEDTALKDALSERYLAYALSTIMSRSLPDVAPRWAEAGAPAADLRDAPVAARPDRRVQEMRPASSAM